ncbi:hypothetical protein CPC16_006303 [Podila verticillata]|nr:hypothetical protein CPC16_006303 [Podila verticillata]
MSRYSVSSFNGFHCHPERPVEEPRSATSVYSTQPYHGLDRDYSDSRHASKQQPRYSSIQDSPATKDKITLPPIFPGPFSQPSPSSSNPTTATTRSAPRTLYPDLSSSFGASFGAVSAVIDEEITDRHGGQSGSQPGYR